MRLSACSFSRSFLLCLSGSRASSPRRVLRLVLAARRRWPSGRAAVGFGSGGVHLRWMVDGCCGVLVSWYVFGRWAR